MKSRTVTVDAVGQREAVPDLATVEALVIGDGNSASEARATAKDRVATLRESLTDVSADQVRTVGLRVQETDEMFDPISDAPIQASERLQIDCSPDTAESVVVDVTNADGQIQSVQFNLHESKHRELQNGAITDAMRRARKKAEQVAATEGLVVAEMLEATTKEVRSGLDGVVDEALASTHDADFSPDPIAVSEAVEAVYELSEE